MAASKHKPGNAELGKIFSRVGAVIDKLWPWTYTDGLASGMLRSLVLEPAQIQSLRTFQLQLFNCGAQNRGPLVPIVKNLTKAQAVDLTMPAGQTIHVDSATILGCEDFERFRAAIGYLIAHWPQTFSLAETYVGLFPLAAEFPEVFLEDGVARSVAVVSNSDDYDIHALACRDRFWRVHAELVRCYPIYEEVIQQMWGRKHLWEPNPVTTLLSERRPSLEMAKAARDFLAGISPTNRRIKQALPRWKFGPQVKLAMANLTETQREIMKALEGKYLNGRQLALQMNMTLRGIQDAIRPLSASELIKNTKDQGYFRPDAPPPQEL